MVMMDVYLLIAFVLFVVVYLHDLLEYKEKDSNFKHFHKGPIWWEYALSAIMWPVFLVMLVYRALTE